MIGPDVSELLPTALRVENGRPVVEWRRVPPAALDSPFFVDGLASTTTEADAVLTDLSFLREVAERAGPFSGLSVIAHVSRCGSTLVSNCMKFLPSIAVLSEPPIMNALLAPRLRDADEGTDAEWNESRRVILKAFGGLVARHFASSRVAIKLSSWSTFGLPLWIEIEPAAPLLVIIRHPIEVAVSNLAHYGFMSTYSGPAEGAEEYCVDVLRRYFGVIAALPPGRATIVDYEQLDAAMIADLLARLFGPLPEGCYARIEAEMRRDSKKTSVAFTADSEQKQALASPELRRLIAGVVDAYERLRDGLRFAS